MRGWRQADRRAFLSYRSIPKFLSIKQSPFLKITHLHRRQDRKTSPRLLQPIDWAVIPARQSDQSRKNLDQRGPRLGADQSKTLALLKAVKIYKTTLRYVKVHKVIENL